MLDLTFQVLAEKRDIVKAQVDELVFPDVLMSFKRRWRKLDLEPMEVCIGGEDGSINHVRHKNLVVYTVNALALAYDKGMKRRGHADIGLLYPYYQVNERLHLYRAIYELKTTLEVIDDVELFLIDGSLLADLKALRTLETGLSKEARKEVVALLPEIEKADGVGIVSHTLTSELGRDEHREKVGFLEYLEYLSALEKLISRGLEKLAGVSKLSTRSTAGTGVPDQAIYEEATKKAGHSPLEHDVIQRRFPAYDELFRSLVFTITHIRLEDRKKVFTLELPREVEEDEIKSLLGKMRSVSVDGYPYILKKAHNDVVIKNRDMERIIKALGIVKNTGREMLK